MPKTLTLIPLAAALVSASCYMRMDEHDHGYGYPGSSPNLEIIEATIDTGAELESTAGDGAGVFVEYAGEGRWRVFVTCDTNITETSCAWDVFASTNDAIDEMSEEELESDDRLVDYDPGVVLLQTFTGADFDGFTIHTTPGETVRIEAWLDDSLDPRFIFWIGDGGLHRGAPTNPIDLTPSSR